MRASVASFTKKFISTFFAATLALGLVPVAAFAESRQDDSAATSSVTDAGTETYGGADLSENQAVSDVPDIDDSVASGSQNDFMGNDSTFSDESDTIEDNVAIIDDSQVAIPAATERINQDTALTTRMVAQAESTRSFFLAQTLESTRTVPIVSANLPLDTGMVDDTEPKVFTEDDGSSSQDEEGDNSEDPDSESSRISSELGVSLNDEESESATGTDGIAAESTVVGSFTYRGITYAMEPDGESVAVMAADYAKLPQEFLDAQAIVLPSMVLIDGTNACGVTRIADGAFAALNRQTAEAKAIFDMERGVLDQTEGEVDSQEESEASSTADIIAITVPASIANIDAQAFAGFDTLQYVIVSADNPNYSMYDGVLYGADQTNLLLIPEGRLGAVHIAPSVTQADPEVFSHCPSVEALVADADSAAYQLLTQDDDLYRNANGEVLEVRATEEGEESLNAVYERTVITVEPGKLSLHDALGGKDDVDDIRCASAVNNVSLAAGAINGFESIDDTILIVSDKMRDHTSFEVISVQNLPAYDSSKVDVVERDSMTAGEAVNQSLYIAVRGDGRVVSWQQGSNKAQYKATQSEFETLTFTTDADCSRFMADFHVCITDRPDGYLHFRPRTGLGVAIGTRLDERPDFSWPDCDKIDPNDTEVIVYNSTTRSFEVFYGYDLMPGGSFHNISGASGSTFLVGDNNVWISLGKQSFAYRNTPGYGSLMYDPMGGSFTGLGTDLGKTVSLRGMGTNFDIALSGAPETKPSADVVFAGWKDIKSGKIYNAGEKLRVTTQMNYVFEAQWEKTGKYSITFDVGRDGGTFSGVSDDLSIGSPARGTTSVTVKVPNEDNPGKHGYYGTYLPAENTVVAPKGFKFMGWATQMWNPETNKFDNVDAIFGNPIYRGSNVYYDPNTRIVSGETAYANGYGHTRDESQWWYTYQDITWYARFMVDLHFESPGKAPTFTDGSRVKTVKADCNQNIPFPALNADGGGWHFGYWYKRGHTEDGRVYKYADGNLMRNGVGVAGRQPKVKLDVGRLEDLTGHTEDESYNCKYLAQWSVDVTWEMAKGSPTEAAFASAAPSMIDHMWNYSLPGLNTLKTHHFASWSMPSNADGSRAPVEAANGAMYYFLDQPGSLIATWAPNEYKVEVKNADGSLQTGIIYNHLYAKYGDGFYRIEDDSLDCVGIGGGNIFLPQRDGFACVGVARRATDILPEFYYTGTCADDYQYGTGGNHAVDPTVFDDETASADTTIIGAGDSARTVRIGYLYPIWKAIATWDFADDGMTASKTEAKTINNDNYPTVTCPTASRPGYRLMGWKVTYEHDATDSTLYAAGQNVQLQGDGTLTAQWEPVSYDISLDLGTVDYAGEVFTMVDAGEGLTGGVSLGGSGGASGTAVRAQATYDVTNGLVTLPTFSRPGYSFLGWIVTQQPSGEASTGTLRDAVADTAADYAPLSFSTALGDNQACGNISLKAVWKQAEPYSITPRKMLDGQVGVGDYYDADQADIPSTYTVSGSDRLDDLVGKVSSSGEPGYAFVGWSASFDGFLLDAATGEVIPKDEVSANAKIAPGLVDRQVTLTAHFRTVYYELTVDLGLPDARAACDASPNWTRIDGGTKSYAFCSTKLMNGVTSGYSLYDTTPIVLPTPSCAGQAFTGWKVEKLDANDKVITTGVVELAGPIDAGGDWSFPVALDTLGRYRITGLWGASEYSLAFVNIDHVADRLTGDFVATTSAAVDSPGYDAALRSFGFTGDDLIGNGQVRLDAPRIDPTRYDAFVGWLLPEGADPTSDLLNADGTWIRDVETGRYFATSFSIGQSNLDLFFQTKNDDGGYMPLVLEALYRVKSDHRAVLDLDGGRLAAADGDWSKDENGAYSLTYSSTTSKRMLPKVSRYGYELIGWTLEHAGTGVEPEELADVEPSDDGVKRLEVLKSIPNEGDAEGYWIEDDRVGDRLYVAQWQALVDTVVFDYNAEQTAESGSNGPGPQQVLFGEKLPHGLTAPQREGYEFRGYYDASASVGGVQYLTESMESVRTWDKAPVYAENTGEVVPHVLYARWVKSLPEDTSPDNQPKPADGASAYFSAKKGEGSVEVPDTGFAASYHGTFTRGTDNVVTVSLESYELSNGTAQDIYDAFELPESAGQKRYLQGFRVDSTGDFIAFADIARGAALMLKFKVSDMASAISDAPSFALDGIKLTAVYTSEPYDFEKPDGGEPPSTDPEQGCEVLAVFDLGGGAINGSSAAVVTSTTYEPGMCEFVMLPDEPQRKGYGFVGWSLVGECAGFEGEAPDHSADAKHEMFRITDTLVKHYVAHWRQTAYPVRLYANDGTSAYDEVLIETGSRLSLAELLGGRFIAPEREGYLFLGYFDAEVDGVQYFGRDGAARRVFDKVADTVGYVSLYGNWLKLDGSEEPGTEPDPSLPDPGDLLPPYDEVTIVPTDSDDTLHLVARDGLGNASAVVLCGTYDGYYAHAEGTDNVAVVMCGYTPDSAEYAVRNAIARFEKNNDPDVSGGTYLQGFRVVSTGSFVSVADLVAGRTVTFVAKMSDLDDAVPPASVSFVAGAVEAVYGLTPPAKPDDWEDEWPVPGDTDDPDSGTQVYNIFDARGGLFGDDAGEAAGKRFVTVSTAYNLLVRTPDFEPNYDAIDPSYRFVGWRDADGKLLVAGTIQTSAVPTTYYAIYERITVPIVLHDAQDGVRDIHRMDTTDDEIARIQAYVGQELTDFKMNGLGQTMAPLRKQILENLPGDREGYDLIGYFYKVPDTGELVPFYLNVENAYASRFIQQQGYSVISAYANDEGTGWGDVTGDLDTNEAINLYAVWNVKLYTIKWTYNWVERDYHYVERDDAGAEVDLAAREPLTVAYGDDITDAIPAVKDPAFSFLGWYAGKTLTGDDEMQVVYKRVNYTAGGHDPDTRAETYADGKPGDRDAYYFTVGTDGVRRFQPTNIEGIDGRGRAFELFAAFGDEAARYNYRVYFGKNANEVHGRISPKVGTIEHDDALDLDYLSYSYRPATDTDLSTAIGSVTNPSSIAADTGYTFAGWYGDPVSNQPLAEPVRIVKGTTGLQKFYLGWTAKPYKIVLNLATLDGDDGVREKPQGTIVLNGAGTYDLDLDKDNGRAIELPTPTGALGYMFKGWKRCDADGTLHLEAPVLSGSDATLTFDASFVQEAFAGASSGTISYGAVWEPIAYEVRFHVQRDAGDESVLIESYRLADDGVAGTDLPSKLALPYPHTKDVGQVFEFWSLERFDGDEACAAWTSAAELTLADILAMQKKLGLAVSFDDLTEGEVPTIDMYAQWRDVVGADVPLQVNMLLDPFSPDESGMGKIITNSENAYLYDAEERIVANGWISTTSSAALRIESLTFERGDDVVFERLDGSDGGSDLDLLVYGGGLGEKASEPLRLNLGMKSTVVLRDDVTSQGTIQDDHAQGERSYLVDHAMDGIIKKEHPLYLYYDMAIKTGDGTLTSYKYLMNDLLDRTETIGSSTMRKSAPLAKLYYTIGLVSKGPKMSAETA